jgi:hypothetical protein
VPLQAEPFERASLLLLAYGVMGGRDALRAVVGQVDEHEAARFWAFHRMHAVALTLPEQWAELGEALRRLERVADRGSAYLAALIGAMREEMAAAQGGPAATHRQLEDLDYLGWSRLLAYRPPTP